MTQFIATTNSAIQSSQRTAALDLAELLTLDQPTGKGRTRDRLRAVAKETGVDEAQDLMNSLMYMLGYAM